MAIKLTQQEINYLRELTIGRKTMTGLKDRSGLKRLVDARYITEDSANVQMTVYSITELGRKALESSIEPKKPAAYALLQALSVINTMNLGLASELHRALARKKDPALG